MRKVVTAHLLRNPAVVVSCLLAVAVTVVVVLPLLAMVAFGGVFGAFGSLSGH